MKTNLIVAATVTLMITGCGQTTTSGSDKVPNRKNAEEVAGSNLVTTTYYTNTNSALVSAALGIFVLVSAPVEFQELQKKEGNIQTKEWKDFVSTVQNGDIIVFFKTSSETWRQLAGREGYAIIRKGECIATVITRMN
jgi:uncharacterized lipoprotein YehR (DUF1307 family)